MNNIHCKPTSFIRNSSPFWTCNFKTLSWVSKSFFIFPISSLRRRSSSFSRICFSFSNFPLSSAILSFASSSACDLTTSMLSCEALSCDNVSSSWHFFNLASSSYKQFLYEKYWMLTIKQIQFESKFFERGRIEYGIFILLHSVFSIFTLQNLASKQTCFITAQDALISLPSTPVPSLLSQERFHLDVLLQYSSLFHCIQKLLLIVLLRSFSFPDSHFLWTFFEMLQISMSSL